MKSLDPRVNRLPSIEPQKGFDKLPLDQFGTFEVFVQAKEGKPFQHEGAVHAPDLELAYILAKETFTRRFTCASLFVVNTQYVFVSPFTEDAQNVYDLIQPLEDNGEVEDFDVYHLLKRGKQHSYVGTVSASNPNHAMSKAKEKFENEKIVYNVWVIRKKDIRFTTSEEMDLWLTLPEKKFRDAADYKGGDKLKIFLEANSSLSKS